MLFNGETALATLIKTRASPFSHSLLFHHYMDRFFGPHSTEAIAYNSLTCATLSFCGALNLTFSSENGLTWDSDHSVDEGLLAGCVAYQALNRFLTGADLFILPRSRTELDSILYASHCRRRRSQRSSQPIVAVTRTMRSII